jgi:ribose 5-phosphate isomerase B
MIYLGCDHAGFNLKQEIKVELTKQNLDYLDLSPSFIEGDDYPIVAELIADNIKGSKDFAIAICGTGQGVCIALNRYKNIRAVSSIDPKVIELTRQHNHANVLCLPGRFIDIKQASYLINLFLTSKEGLEIRHIRRLKMLN